MLFNKIFVEKDILNHTATKNVLSRLPDTTIHPIDNYNDVFGRVKKPYLQKRTTLNLFLAHKKGALVKRAPDAYGLAGEPHYYFVHTYNCIYECEYCYLQGYFNSPDIVLFTNHEDIKEAILNTLDQHPNQNVWFHAGEFSDSLALSHITGECEFYWDTFSELKGAKLELRTKSANIKSIKNLSPKSNIITSFSISPANPIRQYDKKTAPLSARLKSMQTLIDLGHPVGVHLDPIIYTESFLEDYQELFKIFVNYFDLKSIEYFSLGVVRFTKDVHLEVRRNYPESQLHSSEFIKSFDGKVRYSRPMRMHLLKQVKNLLLNFGVEERKVYLCME